ncbi:mitochondrial ribosome-associated GTPase 1-like [Biomphalaria glabrata]|uniref:Mitochondrial GTPase 1 n=1 Tax=Biomphalaria glabrata TaxID=6526 RepID=A0A9U8DXS7_BIOGL|nr:mitochondrial ribosome-associated GTPase 1-like [Biomphalaria glabrata]KAI8768226.1 mitochondrial ribosome-associated GTPase 1-like [Biomphalaria glabrata]
MSDKLVKMKTAFRKVFKLPNVNMLKWYPGHMLKGMLQIQAKLQKIDCIIEVHDARIPFSGRNIRFRDIIKLRPHVLLLNKVDLTNLRDDNIKKDKIINKLKQQGVDTVFLTNLKETHFESFLQKTVLPVTQDLISKRPRYNREEVLDFNYLVIGVPNVGKSTFINSLRSTLLKKKGHATSVGAIAGITRSVLSKIKVSSNPNIYIIDTPGIMPPKFDNIETGMKVAACSCLPDHLVGEINIADFILFWLNKHQDFQYVKYFELSEATDNIVQVLTKIAIKRKAVNRIKDVATQQYTYVPNLAQCAQIFIAAFREGSLGKHVLDDVE